MKPLHKEYQNCSLFVEGIFAFFPNLKITYLLIPCSRVLEKLAIPHLIMKFSALCGTRSFITLFSSPQLLYLSSAKSIQYIPIPFHFLKTHFIFPSMPGSSKWSHSLRFPIETMYAPLPSTIRSKCLTYLILDLINRIMFRAEYRS